MSNEVDLLIEAGHPSRPDREELMRQHIAAIKSRVWDEGWATGMADSAHLQRGEDRPVTANPYRD